MPRDEPAPRVEGVAIAPGYRAGLEAPVVVTDSVGMPDLPHRTIFAMTFGFLGINMAFSLQGSQMSRIAQTIGADPGKLGFFFILPPLVGLVVQPLLGRRSDRTWNRFGRRMPYLLVGAPVAALVMVLLPFSGSLGFGYASLAALVYMAVAICLMDLFSNMCMQPFRMVMGDMVNERQKNFAWAWQQVFANLGGILAALLPALFAFLGVANTAPRGIVPPTVITAFVVAAVVLLVTSLVTVAKVEEYDPDTYRRHHGLHPEASQEIGMWQLVRTAPKAFWDLCLVQLFSWIGIMYTWTYATGTMAHNIWGVDDASSAGYQAAGNWYGVMTAVYSLTAVVWGLCYSRSSASARKLWYSAGLLCASIGILLVATTGNKWVALVAFIPYGIGNFSVNTLPFAMLTSSLRGRNEGAYLGLFYLGVCLPQVVASCASFFLLPTLGHSMAFMMLVGAGSMALAAVSVWRIREGA